MLQFETTNRVLQEERLFAPSDEMREGANITKYMRAKGFQTYEDLHAWTIEHPEEFWAEMAEELHWFSPWEQVRDWQFPYVKWFTGATTNIVYNCLDRHRGTHVWNQIAIYWEGERGETRSLSYADLWRETTKFSDVLTKLGLGLGDKTCVYMPKIPEQFVAMLGTTRIGAAHSVVFSGFSSQALRDRIQEGEAKVVICADGYQYRGKLVDLKAIVDAAVRECPTVEHVIVVKRAGNPVNWVQGRDLWYDDLMSIAKPGMPAVEVDSETPLYYLYTSGSTGKPKGIVHTHGGYMV
ncbi:MAG: AMP-binding protein, partial [Thermomicrobiales bacterium]